MPSLSEQRQTLESTRHFYKLLTEKLRRMAKERAEDSLHDFLRQAWRYLDPAEFVDNWHLEAIAEHLEAVTFGQINRLIVNQPPRTAKSSLVSVAWPAWVWAQQTDPNFPLAGPTVKFLYSSYSSVLAERDSVKTRRIIQSPWYVKNWGSRAKIREDANTVRNFETTAGGYRMATSVGGTTTGQGGDVVIVDDPISASDSNYLAVRESANTWWDEAMSTRLNDVRTGAKVIVMQRLHEDDLTGHVIEREGENWTHLMVPMRYDNARSFHTVIGWKDPRQDDGELLWPEKFPEDEVRKLETALGPFASAGQLGQMPTPRGGGIINRDWWKIWDEAAAKDNGVAMPDGRLTFPMFSYIVASLDTAYGDKDENSYNACTVWGIWSDKNNKPKAMLMEAWRGRWPLLGLRPEQGADLTEDERKRQWGLVERVLDVSRRRNVDVILIENKTRATDLAHELRKLLRPGEVSIQQITPQGDKVSRLSATEPLFADGLVYAPDKAWADMVINEVGQVPKGRFDDLADTCSQALSFLRTRMLLRLGYEADEEAADALRFVPQRQGGIYDV